MQHIQYLPSAKCVITYCSLIECLFIYTHNSFTALFPGPPGWAGARRELLDFMVQRKINRGRHTDHPAGCHSIRSNQCPLPPSPHIFYGPDALPAAQPTVSKHWRQFDTKLNTHFIQRAILSGVNPGRGQSPNSTLGDHWNRLLEARCSSVPKQEFKALNGPQSTPSNQVASYASFLVPVLIILMYISLIYFTLSCTRFLKIYMKQVFTQVTSPKCN